MKKNFMFVLAVVCSIWLLSGVVLAQGHYVIDGSSTTGNQNYEGYSDVDGGVFYVTNTGDLTIESSTFVNNKSTGNSPGDGGGAIYNEGKTSITGGVLFSSNRAKGYGGAIYNNNGSTMTISGTNITFSSNSARYGGAIYNNNGSTMTISGTDIIFSSNTTSSGGAINNENNSKMDIFGDNITFSSNSAYNGGAISNSKSTMTIDGQNIAFTNNIAVSSGGAIYNSSATLNLISKGTMTFTGNTANGVSNAIHDNKGIINLFAEGDNSQIIFNDRITSEYSNSTLNINERLGATGTIVLNEDMRGYTGQVNLYKGLVQIGANGTWFGGNTKIDNATINMANKIIQEHNFNNLTVNKNLNLFVDADLKNKEMDTISADSYSGDGEINVKGINITEDATENKTEILFTSSTALKDKITTIDSASSELYKYNVNYNDGNFSFEKTNIPDSIITESQVATAVGGTITQGIILNQAFASIDNQVIQARLEAKQNNQLYASTTNQLYRTTTLEKGLWIRPYMLQDKIKINGFNVDNTSIGTLAGLDWTVGENSLVSFYIGTAGSTQKYEDIKVNQTGYVLGTTGMIIKEKYYLGLTANINFNKAESENDFVKDKFDMNMYSIGAKAGYNIELGKNWILEPNLTMMYGNINTQGYTTSRGTKVDSKKTNNILIEPQIKAKLALTDGWTPYALVGYVINSGKKVKLVANNVGFEDMQISGYTEYGAGVNKSFKDSAWSCYLQATGKAGDRKGVEGNIGVKYSFSNTKKNNNINNKKTEQILTERMKIQEEKSKMSGKNKAKKMKQEQRKSKTQIRKKKAQIEKMKQK